MHYEKFADGSVECIEENIPMELPNGWTWCRLNSIAAAQPNAFVDGPFGSNLKTEHYTTNREVRIIQLNNIGEFVWKNNGVKYTTFKHAETLDRCVTYPEDIVIAKMMPAGRAIIVPSVESIYVISSDCVRLRVADNIFNKYIMFAINSAIVNDQIQESVHGIGRSRTSLSKCKELFIPIPPIKEQHAICDSIENIFNLLTTIETTKLDLASAINLVKSKILDLAIRGKLVPQNPEDEPASVLLERIRAKKEELIRQGKIKRDKKESIIFKGDDNSYYEKIGACTTCIDEKIPFSLPNGWRWERLGNISTIARGGSPRPIDDYLTDSPHGLNWIKIGDTEKDGKYITKTKEKIIPEGLTKTRFVKSGDFLLTNSMSYGRPYILKTDGCIHDGWLVIGDIEDVFYQDFLYYALSSEFMYRSFSDLAAGSTVKNLKSDSVRSVLFPLPPYAEQKRIALYLDSIYLILENIEGSLS